MLVVVFTPDHKSQGTLQHNSRTLFFHSTTLKTFIHEAVGFAPPNRVLGIIACPVKDPPAAPWFHTLNLKQQRRAFQTFCYAIENSIFVKKQTVTPGLILLDPLSEPKVEQFNING